MLRPQRVGLNAHLLSLEPELPGCRHQWLHLPIAAASTGGRWRRRRGCCSTAPTCTTHGSRRHQGCPFPVHAGTPAARGSGSRGSNPGWRLISRNLDLLHGLAFATPLACACPTVVTVHDLSFLRFPNAFRRFNRSYLSFITRISTRRAARVIAVSESTRQDVITFFGVPGERVVVVPNGVSEAFQPADPAAVADFRRNKGLPEHFILFLGTLEPRKNIVRLLEAYALWLHERPTSAKDATCADHCRCKGLVLRDNLCTRQ